MAFWFAGLSGGSLGDWCLGLPCPLSSSHVAAFGGGLSGLGTQFLPEGWSLWAKTTVVAWSAGFCSQMPLVCLELLGTVFPLWG